MIPGRHEWTSHAEAYDYAVMARMEESGRIALLAKSIVESVE